MKWLLSLVLLLLSSTNSFGFKENPYFADRNVQEFTGFNNEVDPRNCEYLVEATQSHIKNPFNKEDLQERLKLFALLLENLCLNTNHVVSNDRFLIQGMSFSSTDQNYVTIEYRADHNGFELEIEESRRD